MDEYKVMIVEDDPMVMQIHSNYLAKAGGFTVVAVEDEKSECNKMKIREIADYYIEKYPFV